MKPLEIMTEDQWNAILDRVAQHNAMPASLRDELGNVLLARGQAYPLCSTIRGDDDALKFICAQTNTAMLAQVRGTLRPVVDLCEAGLVRIVVPLVRDGGLVGYVASCGIAPTDDEVETFLISKQLGIEEEEAERLAKATPKADEESFKAGAEALFAELNPEIAG